MPLDQDNIDERNRALDFLESDLERAGSWEIESWSEDDTWHDALQPREPGAELHRFMRILVSYGASGSGNTARDRATLRQRIMTWIDNVLDQQEVGTAGSWTWYVMNRRSTETVGIESHDRTHTHTRSFILDAWVPPNG